MAPRCRLVFAGTRVFFLSTTRRLLACISLARASAGEVQCQGGGVDFFAPAMAHLQPIRAGLRSKERGSNDVSMRSLCERIQKNRQVVVARDETESCRRRPVRLYDTSSQRAVLFLSSTGQIFVSPLWGFHLQTQSLGDRRSLFSSFSSPPPLPLIRRSLLSRCRVFNIKVHSLTWGMSQTRGPLSGVEWGFPPTGQGTTRTCQPLFGSKRKMKRGEKGRDICGIQKRLFRCLVWRL